MSELNESWSEAARVARLLSRREELLGALASHREALSGLKDRLELEAARLRGDPNAIARGDRLEVVTAALRSALRSTRGQ